MKEELSKIRGHLVDMPINFCIVGNWLLILKWANNRPVGSQMDDGRRLAFRQSVHFGAIRLGNPGNRVERRLNGCKWVTRIYTAQSYIGDDTIFSILNTNELPLFGIKWSEGFYRRHTCWLQQVTNEAMIINTCIRRISEWIMVKVQSGDGMDNRVSRDEVTA